MRASGCYTDAHTYSYGYGNSGTHGYGYANFDCDIYGDAHSYGYTNGNSKRYTEGYAHAEACTDTEAAPNSGAAPVAPDSQALADTRKRAFPFKQGGMRIIEAAVERVRDEIVQVLFAQFAQRLNE